MCAEDTKFSDGVEASRKQQRFTYVHELAAGHGGSTEPWTRSPWGVGIPDAYVGNSGTDPETPHRAASPYLVTAARVTGAAALTARELRPLF